MKAGALTSRCAISTFSAVQLLIMKYLVSNVITNNSVRKGTLLEGLHVARKRKLGKGFQRT